MARSPIYLLGQKARNYDGYVVQERPGFGGRHKVFGYDFVFNADTERGEEEARIYVEHGKNAEPVIDLCEVPKEWHVKLPNGDIWRLRDLMSVNNINAVLRNTSYRKEVL